MNMKSILQIILDESKKINYNIHINIMMVNGKEFDVYPIKVDKNVVAVATNNSRTSIFFIKISSIEMIKLSASVNNKAAERILKLMPDLVVFS